MNEYNADRLREAVAAAVDRLKYLATPGDPGRPHGSPGDLYVLDTPGDLAIEWLVVRGHPDDPSLALVVPTDDAPLVGPPDVLIPPGRGHVCKRYARCGLSAFVPAATLARGFRFGRATGSELANVRRALGNLARGRVSVERPYSDDPEYDYLLGKVRAAVEWLEHH